MNCDPYIDLINHHLLNMTQTLTLTQIGSDQNESGIASQVKYLKTRNATRSQNDTTLTIFLYRGEEREAYKL